MAITKVRIKIDGKWTSLSKDETGKWKGTITAPVVTSYNLSGGYYPVTIEAANDAGTVRVVEATDGVWGDELKLVVKELIKPVIVLVSPSDGAYVTNNKQQITFRVTDEANGSGINLNQVKLKLDEQIYGHDSEGMAYSSVANGYQFTYTPSEAVEDGKHTIELNAADNDGNAADTVNAGYTVDTVPPALNVSSPAAGLITNNPLLLVEGTTNDLTSSPITLAITLGEVDQGSVTVGRDGAFSKSITLEEGENTIVVTAEDAAGKTSSITRKVKLDTSIPEISSLVLAPNPADTSESVSITVEVV